MARKSKKRRVRRSSKARKVRSSKARKGRKSRRRRSNPGNFVKPTASKAMAYLKQWERKGVKRAQDITLEMVKDAKALRLAKIRFGEAARTAAMYQKAMDAYQAALEQHKAKMAEWRDAKKAGTEMPKPVRPSKPNANSHAKDKGRAGNFLPTSAAHAKAYLKRVFRWNNRVTDKDLKSKSKMESIADASASQWLKAKKATGQIQQGLLGARLAEAVTTVGAAESAKIFRQAQANAAKYAAKKAAAKAKKDAANKTRWQNQLKKLETKQKAVKDKLSKLGAVASRARARMKKARKGRRRNPSRRRNPVRRKAKSARKGKRRVRRARKAKSARKGKRRVRKARKAKRTRKAKKARKSKKRSRKRRR